MGNIRSPSTVLFKEYFPGYYWNIYSDTLVIHTTQYIPPILIPIHFPGYSRNMFLDTIEIFTPLLLEYFSRYSRNMFLDTIEIFTPVLLEYFPGYYWNILPDILGIFSLIFLERSMKFPSFSCLFTPREKEWFWRGMHVLKARSVTKTGG